MGGWVGGWSEDWRVMLNSTQDQVEVEVRVELGNSHLTPNRRKGPTFLIKKRVYLRIT